MKLRYFYFRSVMIRVSTLLICFSISLCLTLSSCQNNTSATTTTTLSYRLDINNQVAWVEVADSEAKRVQGLMYRTKLDPDSGMLFVYAQPQKMSFWMKNTNIPLSIAFITSDGVITDILKMEVYDGSPDYQLPSYRSSQMAQFALEMSQGWFEQKKIQVGDRVRFSPELQKIIAQQKH